MDKNDNMICPKCGGRLVARKGYLGDFIGCSNFPKCFYKIEGEQKVEYKESNVKVAKFVNKNNEEVKTYTYRMDSQTTLVKKVNAEGDESNKAKQHYKRAPIKDDGSWEKVKSEMVGGPEEIPLASKANAPIQWFKAYFEGDTLFIERSEVNVPSVSISNKRRIEKDEFLKLRPYYLKWASGKASIRNEINALSRNTSYVFSIIAYFEL